MSVYDFGERVAFGKVFIKQVQKFSSEVGLHVCGVGRIEPGDFPFSAFLFLLFVFCFIFVYEGFLITAFFNASSYSVLQALKSSSLQESLFSLSDIIVGILFNIVGG